MEDDEKNLKLMSEANSPRSGDSELFEALKLIGPAWYAKMTSPGARTRAAYSRLIRKAASESDRIAFLTVNVDPRTLARSKTPLALELNGLRSSSKPVDAYRIFWRKFFTRFRNDLLKYKRSPLTVTGVLENAGKRLDLGAKHLHLHVLIPLPPNVRNEYFRDRLERAFRRYLGIRRSVKPEVFWDTPILSLEFVNQVDVELADYHGKQMLNSEIASHRFYSFNTNAKPYAFAPNK